MTQHKLIPKAILVISLSVVYLPTLAPGLTWANHGADGGDLIAAAATGGVAHPGGYPTYLILARLFQFIPIGSLAFRTNLMSAVFAVCAALLVYEIVNTAHNRIAALTAAYAFGLSPLFWSQAVITEVYTLHVLFIALFLLFIVKDAHHFLFGLTFGLGLGNHITTFFLLPLLYHREKKFLHQRITGLTLGALVYLTLPLRAMSHPPVNWGDPVTLKNFLWLVSGNLYQGQLFASTSTPLLGKLQTSAALFFEQFGIIGLLVGFIGLVAFHKPTRLNYGMFWVALAFFLFPLAYETRDSFVYLLPVFLCFSIWIGAGLAGLMDAAPRINPALALMLLALIGIRAGWHWSQVDASHDARAENFGRAVVSTVPQNAIVFAEGDQAALALWYYHYALKERPDMAVIATDLLPNEWYQQTLRRNYPALNLPDEFFMFTAEIVAHNPEKEICYIGRDLAIRCEKK
jgi:hypothetical protein